ncbi:BPI fold-containing family B member 4-like [Eublepharis macularius]|uniref:BPI fold-containing family B member 4-like n=1 Tax=Eublepharis macularius TaxID=481883 RepID=A0AA97JFU7_EUBMA|nr:BPI fold-containing family B member 4-like [Eublepharis macularius]
MGIPELLYPSPRVTEQHHVNALQWAVDPSGTFVLALLLPGAFKQVEVGSFETQGFFPHPCLRLHIVKVYLPVISVELKANATAQLHLKTRLHLSAQYHFGLLFERIDIIVDVHVMADIMFRNYSGGIVRFKYEICETEFTIANVVCPSYLIKTRVKPLVLNILTATLPGAFCRVVEMVGNVALFDFLYSANVLFQVRTTTSLHYQLAALPQITSITLALKLNIVIRTAGRFLTVPVSDHAPAIFPSVKGSALCLLFTQDALNAILPVVIRVTPQEFITTPQVFSGSIQLINAVAVLLSHQKCPQCPEKSPLKISLSVVEAATIVLQPSSTYLRLVLEITVGAKDPLGAIIDLFVLKASLKLSVEMSVHDCRLIFFTKLIKVELRVISSDIGHISVTSLTKWMHLLLVETFMPRINDCLNAGIPLPSLLDINVAYPKFLISQGRLVLCV